MRASRRAIPITFDKKMNPLKQIAIVLLALFVSLPAFGDEAKPQEPNPVLEEILQHDVIFTAEYQKVDGNGRFIVQEQLKGENTKLILEYVKINARLTLDDGDKFLFVFWKNGAKEFRMTRINWAKQICRRVDRKLWCVSIKDIKKAVED